MDLDTLNGILDSVGTVLGANPGWVGVAGTVLILAAKLIKIQQDRKKK